MNDRMNNFRAGFLFTITALVLCFTLPDLNIPFSHGYSVIGRAKEYTGKPWVFWYLLRFGLLVVLIWVAISGLIAQDAGVFASKFTVEELRSAPGKLIPFPQEILFNGKYTELDGISVEFDSGMGKDCYALTSEVKRILEESNITLVVDGLFTIRFKENKTITPEGYELQIGSKGIVISASTESGGYYALKTLRQLIVSKDNNAYLPVCEIKDWPAYAIRGFMIDVGRNFQSIESLKKQLDIMAAYKLNTFHWRLTDRPAWRIESNPQLTYAPNHRQTRQPGRYYTYAEIRELIRYAKERHIMVISEIDMPGHSDAFQAAMRVMMESEEGMAILEDVLNEFFDEISVDYCPVIHIGSDETDIPNPEGFMLRMVGVCRKAGREVVIWNPGLNADDRVIRQTWMAENVKSGNYREIDSWESYINSVEPHLEILRLFFKPIGFLSENNVIGGILCLWHDVRLRHEKDAFIQNPVYPAMLTYAWTTWTADLQTSIPRFYHKNKYFADEPFPYFKQQDKKWKLIGVFDGNDGDAILMENRDFYQYKNRTLTWRKAMGNTLLIRERQRPNGYFPKADSGQTAYAMTYIYSDSARDVDVMIGFETARRANKIYTGVPQTGTWDPSGGNVWVNDIPLRPPDWIYPGWNPSKTSGWSSMADREIPWEKQDFYWTRDPTKIHFEKGWNKIFVKIPSSAKEQNRMFTFIPLQMNGLIFSPDKTLE